MIDIEKAIETYKQYVENYNTRDSKIGLKIAHMLRVKENAKEIAKSINLSQEDIDLAELIGLLHDIGRFEQIKRYNTFIDKNSIDHGKLGVQILFDEGLIRNFIKDNQYNNIIKYAVLNHNKNQIQQGLTEREILHAKIIRDADKLDIFNFISFEPKEVVYESDNIEKENFTPKVYNEFIETKDVNYSNMATHADILIAHFRYLYDLNFQYSFQNVEKNSYIDKLYTRIKFENPTTQEQLDNIYNNAKIFLKNYCIKKI